MRKISPVFTVFFVILLSISCTAQYTQETPTFVHVQTPTLVAEAMSTPLEKITTTPVLKPTSASAVPTRILEGIPSNLYLAYLKVDYINVPEIGIISIDDMKYRVLFSGDNVNSTFTVAPSQEKLAFSKFVGVSKYELTLVDFETDQVRGYSIPGCVPSSDVPAWAPDSTEMAISCANNRIAVVSFDSGNLIVKSSLMIDDKDVAIHNPSWSPDGKYLSFYISRPFDARDSSAHGPYLIDMDCYKNSRDCKIKPVALGMEGISRWTPDGFISVASDATIFLFDPTSLKVKKSFVIPLKDTRIMSFAWAPDNQWIAFSAPGYDGEPGTNAVYIMSLLGNSQPILVDGQDGGQVLFWLFIHE
ncbi:MAG: hypothetical protein L6461_08790 [Anaerolineae bacterium]|nr:hypothetical protein [Anaerolineae bacterium]